MLIMLISAVVANDFAIEFFLVKYLYINYEEN